jgi:hypothetical protein
MDRSIVSVTTMGIPLRPDPDALRLAERRSFLRATAALALSAINRQHGYPGDIINRYWRGDGATERVLKATTSPTDASTFWQLRLA